MNIHLAIVHPRESGLSYTRLSNKQRGHEDQEQDAEHVSTLE